jgi:biopolymer transport protein ExbD
VASHIDTDEMVASINVTPFVDVVLVLLVVLMVTSTDLVRAQIGVDLPRAASADESVASTVNLIVSEEGALYLDGDPASRDQIAAAVRAERVRDPALQVVISADGAVDYAEVIGLIDLVKHNGVTAFALNVEPGAAP